MIRLPNRSKCTAIVSVVLGSLQACQVRQPQADAARSLASAQQRSRIVDEQPARNIHLPALAARGGAQTTPVRPLDRFVTRAIELVGNRRGWPRLTGLSVVEASAEDLRTWLVAELTAQIPHSVGLAQDRSLSLLGLVPDGYDTGAAILGVLARTVQGVYLPARGTIALRRGLPAGEAWLTLTHEVVHGYEDRLFALGQVLSYHPSQSDRIAAMHGLAEGEATALEVEMARTGLVQDGADLSEAGVLRSIDAALAGVELPEVLRRSLVAPYRDGYRFVSYLRRIGQWELVDRVWRRGLVNTAELLHPERWITLGGVLSETSPLGPAASSQLGTDLAGPTAANQTGGGLDDAGLVLQDSFGEQGLRIVLEASGSVLDAAEIAASWQNDAVWLWRREDGDRLAWHVRVNTAQQAAKLGAALQRSVLGRSEGVSSCRCLASRTVSLMQRNRDILVAASGYSDTHRGATARIRCQRLQQWAGIFASHVFVNY